MIVFDAVTEDGQDTQFGLSIGDRPLDAKQFVEGVRSIVEAAEETRGPLRITGISARVHVPCEYSDLGENAN